MKETIRSNKIRRIQKRLFRVTQFSVRAFLILVLAGMGLSPSIPSPSVVSAAVKRPPRPPVPPPGAPTPPSNLRITGITSSTVSLAWNPSTDDSGSFAYFVQFSGGLVQRVPQTQTTAIWTTNLTLGRTYSFLVYAVDFQNNRSANSNTVNATIPGTPTPLTAPVITVTDVGVRHVSLAWLSTGGTPSLRYLISKDGVLLNQQAMPDLSDTFFLLAPNTTYTFTVQARDGSNTFSPPTHISVTTEPSNPNDVTPPTAPAPVDAYSHGDLEMSLFWTQSVDDFDAQSVIRYDIYVNGHLEDIVIGGGFLQTLYGERGVNTITVIAIDTAGNQSAPATINVTL